MFSKRVAFELKFQVRSKTYHGFYTFSSRSNIFHFPKKLSRNSSSFSNISLQRERERETKTTTSRGEDPADRQTCVHGHSLFPYPPPTQSRASARACSRAITAGTTWLTGWLAGWLTGWHCCHFQSRSRYPLVDRMRPDPIVLVRKRFDM